jgi:hypothetical protein
VRPEGLGKFRIQEKERKSNEIEKMVMKEAVANLGVFAISASRTNRCFDRVDVYSTPLYPVSTFHGAE